MKRIVLFVLLLVSWAAWGQDTLYISTSQVVHLRFASELKYVNLGSRDIVAKIVDGSKDFVAVKAREAFSAVTSMSCLESNGAMHTFLVAYREHPERLERDMREILRFAQNDRGDTQNDRRKSLNDWGEGELKRMATAARELYHIGTQGYGIEVMCENIFVKNDVLFLVMSLRNDSAVSYELSAPRFAVESLKRTRRGVQYEKAVFPRQSYGLGTVSPSAEGRLVFTFDKMALLRGQVFRVYFYEKGGARNLTLSLGMSDVNSAVRIK